MLQRSDRKSSACIPASPPLGRDERPGVGPAVRGPEAQRLADRAPARGRELVLKRAEGGASAGRLRLVAAEAERMEAREVVEHEQPRAPPRVRAERPEQAAARRGRKEAVEVRDDRAVEAPGVARQARDPL